MNRLLRRTAVSVGLAVAAVAIAVPLTTGGAASAASTSFAPAAEVVGLTEPAGAHVPKALKADLKAAWAVPDGQRVAALQAVLDKAAGGAYGEKAARRATEAKARIVSLPAALRADVNAAIELPKDQRREALKQIRVDVRAGKYGDVKGLKHLFPLKHHR